MESSKAATLFPPHCATPGMLWRALRALLFVLLVCLTLVGVPLLIAPPPRPGAPKPQGAITQLYRRKRRRKRRQAG